MGCAPRYLVDLHSCTHTLMHSCPHSCTHHWAKRPIHAPSQNPFWHTRSPFLALQSRAGPFILKFLSHYLFFYYVAYPLFLYRLIHSQTLFLSSYHIFTHSFHVFMLSHCALICDFIYSFTNTNKLSYSFTLYSITSTYSTHCSKVI